MLACFFFFFFQAEDGIRDRSPSRGLGDVYKRQVSVSYNTKERVAIVTNAALLPDTGGAGTMWFLMFGLLLMGAGVVWYVRNQRVQSGTVRSGSSRIRKRGAHAA